jgi:acetyl-CoA carboxylase biotin carboxyl carrier protein
MELKDIKKIIQMMSENELSEFLLEDESCTLQLKRGATEVLTQLAAAPAPVAAPAAAPAAPAADSAADIGNEGLVEITSPMVGTFYRAPSPEADSFVEVGQEVTVDSVVCIVEAMKVMNEIQSDVRGTIKKILVDNATPVQFGQPLFLVDPA